MSLESMLKDDAMSIAAVASYLDGLDHAARVEAVFALDRGGQRRLYRLAQATPALSLDHFVPAAVADVTQVRHLGKNSLPLPRKHRLFEKRFCRPDDGSARLFGFNEAPSRKLVGPGYFVARPTADEPRWVERGPVVVDYFMVPEVGAALPQGWPTLVPNSKGLQRFVYNGTRDFMRGVSGHVSIGAAYKGERSLDHYFVLVRLDD